MPSLSREIPEVTVYINGKASPFQPLTVQRSIGGRRLDYATLVFDPSRTQARFVDVAVISGNDPRNLCPEIEIVRNVNGAAFVDFFGRASWFDIGIAQERELQTVTARIERWMFGGPLFDFPRYNPLNRSLANISGSPTFNPRIDGQIFGNQHPKEWQLSNAFSRTSSPIFMDPESGRTATAQSYQGGAAKEWKLSDAVFWACQLNRLQRYFLNPAREELAAIVDDKRDLIRNLHLRPGMYLPDALDALLDPFGYSWFIDLNDRRGRVIRIFRRGEGRSICTVSLQRPGAVIDPEKGSNLIEAEIKFDSSELVNQVTGLGDFAEIEITAELFRAWPQSQDALSNRPDQLRVDHSDYEKHPNAYRKYVLNEAGDYNGLRPEIKAPFDFLPILRELWPSPTVGLPDLDRAKANQQWDTWLQNFVCPARRKLLPCLTLIDENGVLGRLEGVKVEIGKPVSDNGELINQIVWRENTYECRILEQEAGIFFSGNLAPGELWLHGDDARVRVTACIRLDFRITGFAKKQDTSPQPEVAEIVLDLQHRFHMRKISKTSIHFSDVKNGKKKSLQIDDSARLQEYCEGLRDAFDFTTIDGSLRLEGIDRPCELGQSVPSIVGRNISLSGTPRNVPPKFPQIAGITRDYQRQTTLLTLDHYRSDRKFALDEQGI